MRDSDLRYKERFARVTDAANQLGEWLILGILKFLDEEFRGEESCLIPIVHFQPRPGSLSVALGVTVDPSHSIRHYHLALLRWRGLVSPWTIDG